MTHNMTRIVGGVDVEANEYPWQVGLVHCTTLYCTVLYFTVLLQVGLVHGPTSRKPFCGGTLISDHEVRHRVDTGCSQKGGMR